jgi:hypothetical protein
VPRLPRAQGRTSFSDYMAPLRRRIVLVVSGTSQQGIALINQIGASHPTLRVYALTRRSPDSEAARELLAAGKVERIVRGDLDDPESIRQVFDDARRSSSDGGGGIKAVFAVLPFPGLGKDTEGERKQGKVRPPPCLGNAMFFVFFVDAFVRGGQQLLADLSFEYGVEQFVYSSAERGGEENDDAPENEMSRGKIAIERHIKALGDKGLNWTYVSPGSNAHGPPRLLADTKRARPPPAFSGLPFSWKTLTGRLVALRPLCSERASVRRRNSG